MASVLNATMVRRRTVRNEACPNPRVELSPDPARSHGARIAAMGFRAASPVMVGRERELARLAEALDASIESGSAVVLVGG
jgi:hypothetical protein